MAIKFETQKILISGKPYRKIINFEMLSYFELPDLYKNDSPAVYIKRPFMSSPKFITKHASGKEDIIEKGESISEGKFHQIIETAKAAGLILHEINKRNKKRYPEHFAKEYETVKI